MKTEGGWTTVEVYSMLNRVSA